MIAAIATRRAAARTPMKRRQLLQIGLASGVSGASLAGWPGATAQDDKWGRLRGYPTGLRGGMERAPEYRVGNYSGGFERIFPHHVIAAPAAASTLAASTRGEFSYRWGLFGKSPEAYLDRWPATGLLICRDDAIFHESYRFGRTAEMRLTSWSMAKSVTSLLLGICLDRRLIGSYDDLAEKYVPRLRGTLHGGVSLRHLSNMSSGAEVVHARDNPQIYGRAFNGVRTSIDATVADWNQRREEPGRSFNYNELCPLTLGMVMRAVTGQSLSTFAQEALWQPMGAQADATWTTDSERNEFNCIGFAATLRDWARLGLLVANRGQARGVQVVSEAWIDECTRWSGADAQVRYGRVNRDNGYKAHFWHARPDGSRPFFNGHHGQRVFIDMPSRTVLVQTALDSEGLWEPELHAMLDAAARL